MPLKPLLRLALLAIILGTAARATALERWLYCPQNLLVDQNVTNLIALMQRASQAGYTHVMISDSKFSRLADMSAHYFQNINQVKQAALNFNLEVVPAVFPIGYSNDLLYNDPNLIEGLPVQNTLLVVQNGVVTIQPDPPVSFPGGDFSNLSLWTWKDSTVVASNGTAMVMNPNGANARIVQHLTVKPFRAYHISVQIKTQNFPVAPQVTVLAGNRSLTYNNLGVQPTQDWQTHHVIFNSLTNTDVNIYFGVWGGTTGTLWWDNATIEEVAFLNLIRRPGAPLAVQIEGGRTLTEGIDFTNLTDPLMGSQPWAGNYDVYHTPPLLQTSLPNGTRLRASWYQAVTVYDGQANVCVSEPKTLNLLRDQAQRMHAAWGAKGYFMSHDEIRVFNWCAACQARQMDAGAMLADNVRTCASILRSVNPGGRIYVWSDMFDPNHNAHNNYYLVRGDLTNSWLGLDPDIIISPWDYDQRAASLKFFAGLGNRQVIAGYYDADPTLVTNWLAAATPYLGISGVMYTTWQQNYSALEQFEQLIAAFPQPAIWFKPRLEASAGGGQLQLTLLGERGRHYALEQSSDLAAWTSLTNFTAADATVAFTNLPPPVATAGQYYRGVCFP